MKGLNTTEHNPTIFSSLTQSTMFCCITLGLVQNLLPVSKYNFVNMRNFVVHNTATI